MLFRVRNFFVLKKCHFHVGYGAERNGKPEKYFKWFLKGIAVNVFFPLSPIYVSFGKAKRKKNINKIKDEAAVPIRHRKQ